jgi:nitrogen fixation NifU-like protein
MQPNELDDLYREVILDHYRTRRNSQRLSDAQVESHGNNPFCGDEIFLQLQLNDDGTIQETGNQGQGCSISQASSSLMSDALKGRTLEEAEALRELFRRMLAGEQMSAAEIETLGELEALHGVRQFPVRIKCALLAWSVLEDGVKEYRKR